jgi:hypothetical protein
MWSAFPTSDYYEDSVPKRRHALTMGVSCTFRYEGNAAWVPTFTDFRLTGMVLNYTPAASPRAKRSYARGLVDAIGMRRRQAGATIGCRGPSAAPAQIYQVRAG